MIEIVHFAVLVTAIYFVLCRAEITRFLWKQYRRWPWFDRMTMCAACCGWWLGLALYRFAPPLVEWHGGGPIAVAVAVLGGGAWGLMLTPIGTWLLLAALNATTIDAPPPKDEG